MWRALPSSSRPKLSLRHQAPLSSSAGLSHVPIQSQIITEDSWFAWSMRSDPHRSLRALAIHRSSMYSLAQWALLGSFSANRVNPNVPSIIHGKHLRLTTGQMGQTLMTRLLTEHILHSRQCFQPSVSVSPFHPPSSLRFLPMTPSTSRENERLAASVRPSIGLTVWLYSESSSRCP